VTSTKRYLRVTSITIPIQAGAGGTATVGVRAPVTADGTSGTKVVCTSAAGELHSYELVTANFGGLTTATTDPGIATDLAAIAAADNDWFGLASTRRARPRSSPPPRGARPPRRCSATPRAIRRT
jgi:hypothetical protein